MHDDASGLVGQPGGDGNELPATKVVRLPLAEAVG
jgi:hypothetical protein